MNTNPLGIIFREKDHKYFSALNKNHVSVTTKLKEYQNPFPSDALAKYALKNNLSEEYVKYCWDEQRRLGTEIGSWLHIQLENRIDNKIPDLDYLLTKEDSIRKEIVKQKYLTNYKIQIQKYLQWRKKYTHIKSEAIVGNELYAGQIDELNAECIHDYKNDKVIKFTNPYQKMLPPFQDLDDCNWNKYCLQINFYHYLLPKEIKSKFSEPHKIIKFDRYSKDYQMYEVPDMQDRIKKIMK